MNTVITAVAAFFALAAAAFVWHLLTFAAYRAPSDYPRYQHRPRRKRR